MSADHTTQKTNDMDNDHSHHADSSSPKIEEEPNFSNIGSSSVHDNSSTVDAKTLDNPSDEVQPPPEEPDLNNDDIDDMLIPNPATTKENISATSASAYDDRILVYDSPTMISDLETHLQCIVRPDFHLLEILCHVHGFVEDTAYLFVDFEKIFAAAMVSDANNNVPSHSNNHYHHLLHPNGQSHNNPTSINNKCLALSEFIIPRLALKTDESDITRWKLILYLQPFQKHGFTGMLSDGSFSPSSRNGEFSSAKFKEPPLFHQVIVEDVPEVLDRTPWPSVFDSAKLHFGEEYLNHALDANQQQESQSRRSSVRSSLFAKAWLSPNASLTNNNNGSSANSTMNTTLTQENNNINNNMMTIHTDHSSPDDHHPHIVSPLKSTTHTSSLAASSLPKVTATKDVHHHTAKTAAADDAHFALTSPTAAAYSAAMSMFPNLQQLPPHHHPHHQQAQSSSPRITSNTNNNNNNNNSNINNINNNAGFLPRLVDPLVEAQHHQHQHSTLSHMQPPHSRRESFAKESLPSSNSHHSNPLNNGNGAQGSAQGGAKTGHIYDFLIGDPVVDGGGADVPHLKDKEKDVSFSLSQAVQSKRNHLSSKEGGVSSNGSSNKVTRDRLQRRSLGNATFASPGTTTPSSSGKGSLSTQGHSKQPVEGSSVSLTGGSSRLLRRSFGMDPLQAKGLETPSAKLTALNMQSQPIGAASSKSNSTHTNNNNNNNNNNNMVESGSLPSLAAPLPALKSSVQKIAAHHSGDAQTSSRQETTSAAVAIDAAG